MTMTHGSWVTGDMSHGNDREGNRGHMSRASSRVSDGRQSSVAAASGFARTLSIGSCCHVRRVLQLWPLPACGPLQLSSISTYEREGRGSSSPQQTPWLSGWPSHRRTGVTAWTDRDHSRLVRGMISENATPGVLTEAVAMFIGPRR